MWRGTTQIIGLLQLNVSFQIKMGIMFADFSTESGLLGPISLTNTSCYSTLESESKDSAKVNSTPPFHQEPTNYDLMSSTGLTVGVND